MLNGLLRPIHFKRDVHQFKTNKFKYQSGKDQFFRCGEFECALFQFKVFLFFGETRGRVNFSSKERWMHLQWYFSPFYTIACTHTRTDWWDTFSSRVFGESARGGEMSCWNFFDVLCMFLYKNVCCLLDVENRFAYFPQWMFTVLGPPNCQGMGRSLLLLWKAKSPFLWVAVNQFFWYVAEFHTNLLHIFDWKALDLQISSCREDKASEDKDSSQVPKGVVFIRAAVIEEDRTGEQNQIVSEDYPSLFDQLVAGIKSSLCKVVCLFKK